MTGRIFLKLIAGVFCLLAFSLVTVDYFAAEVAKSTYIQNLTTQLAEKARMLDIAFATSGGASPEMIHRMAQATEGRITLVDSSGKVLIDSEADASSMENHRGRPEVLEAFAGRTGSNIRHSATIGISFLYVAVPARGGALRIAVPLSRINQQVGEIRTRILAAAAIAFFPAILVAALLSRLISRRLGTIMAHAGELARGNFRARLPNPDSSELGALESTLNETAENLQKTVEQLQSEHSELEKLERIRKDFVINVSHELRTPLASIQGYTETLLDGAINDTEHNMRFLGIIRHNAERLARLTSDLLSLSRIEQKRQKFEFDFHSVNAMIQDAIELLTPIAGKKDIVLMKDLAPADVLACCDNEAVSQVLSNLLDNAIKYTPENGCITVGARLLDARYVELYVRDSGIGIPAEDVPRLFERFYRVDKARSRELGGTGLGLSIVKHLVIAHTGAIRVESNLGTGSTFFFTLPVDETVLGRMPVQLNPEFTAL